MTDAGDSGEITRLLASVAEGSDTARDALAARVYAELRRIAVARLREERRDSLGVTGLVHEAFLRLDQTRSMSFTDRRHYFGAAAKAMRRILIDRARYHHSLKRPDLAGALPIEEAGVVIEGVRPEHILDLDRALDALSRHDPALARLVQLKYFAGLGTAEIAELLETSQRTVERRWQTARAWLATEMGEP